MKIATSKSVFECKTKEELDVVIQEQLDILDVCDCALTFFDYCDSPEYNLYVESGQYYCVRYNPRHEKKYVPLSRLKK